MKDYKELSRKEFNKEASQFDQEKGMNVYRMCKNSYHPILEEVKKENFTTLLDVGCGTGNSIQKLYEELPDRSYTGIDLASRMIEIAERKKLKGTAFFVGDAEHLPFEKNRFDVIICKESFHHYPNVTAFFESAYRVLRPGGRLIILDMTISKIPRWIENHLILPFLKTGDVHVYGIDEVRKLYMDAGFTVERADKIGNMRFLSTGKK